MSGSRLPDYIDHIHQAATDACSFAEGLDKDDFLADKRTQQAVIMSLIIIGEAATKVMDSNPEFTHAHQEIPWRSIRGMRNRIAHGYFDIDLEVVWDTVQTALPELLKQLPGVTRLLSTHNATFGAEIVTAVIDTGTPSGRFFFHAMDSLAEMERERTVERIRAGLEAVRQLGRKGGRKPKMTDSKIESAKKLLASGIPPRDVAKNLDVSVPTLYRWVPASAHA